MANSVAVPRASEVIENDTMPLRMPAPAAVLIVTAVVVSDKAEQTERERDRGASPNST